jgi:Domain of unknown function (DUF1707)/Domain of unknown function (DUF4190)
MAARPVDGTPQPLDPGPVPVAGRMPGAYAARMRAASADRERAIDVLRAAFNEGRLARDEYDERAARACASRTYGELAELIADLPVGPLGTLPAAAWPPHPPVPGRVRTNRTAVAALVCSLLPTGITSILAVALGCVACRQIKETGEDGLGIAGAGITLGWVGIALFTGYFVASFFMFATQGFG